MTIACIELALSVFAFPPHIILGTRKKKIKLICRINVEVELELEVDDIILLNYLV